MRGDEVWEAILAALESEKEGYGQALPVYGAIEAVSLRLRRKDAVSNAGPAVATAAVPLNGKTERV